MSEILRCYVCEKYTLLDKCVECGEETKKAEYEFSKIKSAVQKEFKKR